MAAATQTRTTRQAAGPRQTRAPQRFSDRVSARAERLLQVQLGAVLRAKDTVSTATPASLRKRVERELRASERRGAAGQKAISRELQRRRDQLARITQRHRAAA